MIHWFMHLFGLPNGTKAATIKSAHEGLRNAVQGRTDADHEAERAAVDQLDRAEALNKLLNQTLRAAKNGDAQ